MATTPVLAPVQQWVIALTRHVSGNLSVVASSIIVYHVVLRMQKERTMDRRCHDLVTPYHRLMLGFSLADIAYSFWIGLSTLVVPASSGVVYGFGSTATCSAQGFFMQFSVATHLYMAVLSTYFLLKIRYNISDDVLYRRYEVWFHLIPWSVAIATGIMGLVLKVYNPMTIPEIGCWLGPYPADCFAMDGPPCTRGYKLESMVNLYAVIMAYIWLFVSFLIVLWSNALIYVTVKQQERRNEQYLASKLQHQWSLVFTDAPKILPPKATALAPPASGSTIITGSSTLMAPSEPALDEDNENDPISAAPGETTEHTENDDCIFETSSPSAADGTAVSGKSPSRTVDEVKSSIATTVRSSDRTHAHGNSSSNNRRRSSIVSSRQRNSKRVSRAAFVQCMLYVSSAGFTVLWIFLPFVVYKLVHPSRAWRFFAVLMMSAFTPLQGLFNLMVFVRLEYLRLRSCNKGWTRLHCVKQCLFAPDITDPGIFKSRRSVVVHQR